jgi:RNA polymerase sigma-70 factor (ECF subfamily)
MNTHECESIFEMLSEYLDGELPASTCKQLEEHIRGCEPCIEFLDSLRKSVRLGRQYTPEAPVPPMPPEVKQSLRDAYQRMLAGKGRGGALDSTE